MERSILLSKIANELNFTWIGNDLEIRGLNLCNRKTQYDAILSYATSETYMLKAEDNPAVKALILTPELFEISQKRNGRRITILISETPETDFYAAHNYLYHTTDFYNKFTFPSETGKKANIHATAIIEDGVVIGSNATIGAYTVIKSGTVIGDNVSIGCGTAIGSEGFQVIMINDVPTLIVHTGGCHISDGVSILNNVVISKSLFEGATFIGENVKINSLVNVDHNCRIEKNAVLTASVSLCGSSYVKSGAWLGTGSTVLNNVTVGKNALLGIGCVAIRDIPDGAVAVGNPARIIRYK